MLTIYFSANYARRYLERRNEIGIPVHVQPISVVSSGTEILTRGLREYDYDGDEPIDLDWWIKALPTMRPDERQAPA